MSPLRKPLGPNEPQPGDWTEFRAVCALPFTVGYRTLRKPLGLDRISRSMRNSCLSKVCPLEIPFATRGLDRISRSLRFAFYRRVSHTPQTSGTGPNFAQYAKFVPVQGLPLYAPVVPVQGLPSGNPLRNPGPGSNFAQSAVCLLPSGLAHSANLWDWTEFRAVCEIRACPRFALWKLSSPRFALRKLSSIALL